MIPEFMQVKQHAQKMSHLEAFIFHVWPAQKTHAMYCMIPCDGGCARVICSAESFGPIATTLLSIRCADICKPIRAFLVRTVLCPNQKGMFALITLLRCAHPAAPAP